jgi:hypothetical protein
MLAFTHCIMICYKYYMEVKNEESFEFTSVKTCVRLRNNLKEYTD